MGCGSSKIHSDSEKKHKSYNDHERQLTFNLDHHRIKRIPVLGDGNCLFYALTYGLIHLIKSDSQSFGYAIGRKFQLYDHLHPTDFAYRLRQICVQQWKFQKNFYSQFVILHHSSFDDELWQFSQNGVYDSVLGDIVPLTISNIFNVDILIFTSNSHLSRIQVQPMKGYTSSDIPPRSLFLAYNQYNAGHYDAAYPLPIESPGYKNN